MTPTSTVPIIHPALVLFDIDGTLVRRAGPHHRQALVDAVRKVTGLETSTDHIPVHGMLDPDIITRMMLDGGATQAQIRRAMPEVVQRAQALYVRRVPDLQRKTCPGARALLGRLQRRGILLGLVTGNLTRIGWKKLERAGLKEFFRFGAFGEMARDRAGLARMAIREARGKGYINRHTPISLVGDAPSDILAAKANGIRAIAVYTGISSKDELAVHNPDLLLEDLRALRPEMLYS
jgi:phosphoglycolate phosphatase-like HAD superfamily hydrolase